MFESHPGSDFSFDVERKARRGGEGRGGERIKSVIRVYSLHRSAADGKAQPDGTHT